MRSFWHSFWPSFRQSIRHACYVAGLATLAAHATDLPGSGRPLGSARLYDITIETSMPNLRENLRYAVTRRQQCLSRSDLPSVFPILGHPSLAGCKLREQSYDNDSLTYMLICASSAGTTGKATWDIRAHVIHGTLEVKLGGKNMTFHQHVRGTLMGECPSKG